MMSSAKNDPCYIANNHCHCYYHYFSIIISDIRDDLYSHYFTPDVHRTKDTTIQHTQTKMTTGEDSGRQAAVAKGREEVLGQDTCPAVQVKMTIPAIHHNTTDRTPRHCLISQPAYRRNTIFHPAGHWAVGHSMDN